MLFPETQQDAGAAMQGVGFWEGGSEEGLVMAFHEPVLSKLSVMKADDVGYGTQDGGKAKHRVCSLA